MKFSHQFTVSAEDIDEQGHVNNVACVRWIQDIAVAHWRDAATDEMQASFSWVVIRHEIDYRKPVFESDVITASTWVGEWTAVTCERFSEIRRNDELMVKGRTVWCMFDRGSAKPARISPGLRMRFI